MIVATAGHVDHGKTELVKALTGVDTDRLPEEKERGLTIELGFAYQPFDDGQIIGIVDVPGHERFIKNMLAGVGGIDAALLVIAADDGVMPQTREHAMILGLLGIKDCVVVITKTDRADVKRIEDVKRDAADLLAAAGMDRAPVYPVCALSGEGIGDLYGELRRRARASAKRNRHGHFRLAIDRCFTIRGAGVVVTGTVFSGEAKVGERLTLSPTGLEVRVRGLHAQNRDSSVAVAGDRCALNIVGKGVAVSAVSRGDWIVHPDMHAPTQRIDARIRLLHDEERALKHWTPVHVHLGAGHVTGRVAVLGKGSIAPGGSGLAQLVLREQVVTVNGDRLILRDQSARRTIGGGKVIDPNAPKRGRAKPERLEWLGFMEIEDHSEALRHLLATQRFGLPARTFFQARNITVSETDSILEGLSGSHVEIFWCDGEKSPILITRENWQTLLNQVMA
ncbi:MAG: selenocysteine-specific translation elongation factor, partial [Methyloligellaceae bacterium]